MTPSDSDSQTPGAVVISNMEVVDSIDTFIGELDELKRETQTVTKRLSDGQQVEVYVSEML